MRGLDTSSTYEVEFFLDGRFKAYPIRDFVNFKGVNKTFFRGELKYSVPESYVSQVFRDSLSVFKDQLEQLASELRNMDDRQGNLDVRVDNQKGFINFVVRFR